MAKLIYLMGASGAGKDTLLNSLKQQCFKEKKFNSYKNKIIVAHRYITRETTHQSENYIVLSEEEFFFRKNNGLFALEWQANGHFYGIGLEVDVWMKNGLDVIINGSRAHVQEAKQKYGEQLIVVCLNVSSDVLRQRLIQRGRESIDAIELRLKRAENYANGLPKYTHFIDNEGDIESSLKQFISLIRLVNTDSKGKRVSFE